MSDPTVAAVPVRDTGEPLRELPAAFGPARARVRAGLAARLDLAQHLLPDGLALRVVEGHRPLAAQQTIVAAYREVVRAAHPGAGAEELLHLTSRFVAPVDVAPHVAGAAVDLTLVDADGAELDLGTPVDATPEDSAGACFTAAELPAAARRDRDLLVRTLSAAGLVNYPTEWWHWSFGDRYWAVVTGAPAALYGPLP
ncbi:M15 family metallopeptidase [Kineococcus rhizosphaerae]|uniref:D-alanyl-D-alanine dipeptidase n=1 Tax=Kineococcus rhizosphaerae TaxID=559628 RepID=A0A2T0R328_9ACTN|nr:M15 family metallopeptidase [Kineococcus rhizosphaerae]PRY14171.1 D-alanyl-D-alanine dipeptidase [Kineococcus rhizosphaerae]